MKQITATVDDKAELNPGIYRLSIHAPLIAASALPGQFVMIDCGNETILRRPISIHNTLNKTHITLLIKTIGIGTRNLADIAPGKSINLIGPLGNGFEIWNNAQNILLIAGGMGIAPMLFVAEKAKELNKRVTLFMGADTETSLYPQRLIPQDIEYLTATIDGSKGKKGLITDFIPDIINNYDQAFACGPVNMYKSLKNTLDKINYTGNLQVSLEVRMGCGFGICYGCTIKTEHGLKQVCKDGPVFDVKQINWEWVLI